MSGCLIVYINTFTVKCSPEERAFSAQREGKFHCPWVGLDIVMFGILSMPQRQITRHPHGLLNHRHFCATLDEEEVVQWNFILPCD
jgi:hypothetical protein